MLVHLPHPGPSPMILHLLMAGSLQSILPGAWKILKTGSVPLNPALQSLAAHLQTEELQQEISQQLENFVKGVYAYRTYPAQVAESDNTIVWHKGTTRLRRFSAQGKPVLLIPSLVNRWHILDLDPDISLIRALIHAGYAPFVVDWDSPGDQEKSFDLEDYINRLKDILGFLDDPLQVIGYCMGGTLALALAVLEPKKVKSLSLLASPWDFHTGRWKDLLNPKYIEGLLPLLEKFEGESIPSLVLQSLFFWLDPWSGFNKFRDFTSLDRDSDKARRFVLTEHWLNDGVALSTPLALQCLLRWYMMNDPAQGRWRVSNIPIEPKRIECPTLLIQPLRDKIVPPESSMILRHQIREITLETPDTGHIGMIAGSRSSETYDTIIRHLLKVN